MPAESINSRDRCRQVRHRRPGQPDHSRPPKINLLLLPQQHPAKTYPAKFGIRAKHGPKRDAAPPVLLTDNRQPTTKPNLKRSPTCPNSPLAHRQIRPQTRSRPHQRPQISRRQNSRRPRRLLPKRPHPRPHRPPAHPLIEAPPHGARTQAQIHANAGRQVNHPRTASNTR